MSGSAFLLSAQEMPKVSLHYTDNRFTWTFETLTTKQDGTGLAGVGEYFKNKIL